MHLNGRPVAGFDPEGLIFAAGIDSRILKLYDLKSFDKVRDRTRKGIWNEIKPDYFYLPSVNTACWMPLEHDCLLSVQHLLTLFFVLLFLCT